MPRLVSPLILVCLAGCGNSPVGAWSGTEALVGADDRSYVNEMDVADDQTADITLYVLYQEGETWMIGMGTFVADWEQDGEDVTFDVACDWEACTWASTMDCALEDDTLDCDMTPDYYADDAAMLQWEREPE